MAVLKKLLYIAGRTFYIGTFVVTAIIILAWISFYFVIPVVTDIYAANLANDIKKLSLPENTELIDSFSLAANFAGTGNATDIFGAIIIKSELSLEQLQAHYAHYSVEPQTEDIINVIHGQFKFNIKNETTPLINHYIVYAFANPPEFLRLFDYRGN